MQCEIALANCWCLMDFKIYENNLRTSYSAMFTFVAYNHDQLIVMTLNINLNNKNMCRTVFPETIVHPIKVSTKLACHKSSFYTSLSIN